jgi:hypothetical protein
VTSDHHAPTPTITTNDLMTFMHTHQYQLWLLLCAFYFPHCTEEPKGPTPQTVSGIWEVKSALRNKRPTGLLAGTYFIFSENGNMKSNLPLSGEQGEWQTTFEIMEDTLFQKSIPDEKYWIKSWSDSSLTLEFSTRGIPFQLMLSRSTLEKVYPPIDSTNMELQ